MNRNDVTEQIVFNRAKKKLTWAGLAEAVGKSKEWTTAALLGKALTLVSSSHSSYGSSSSCPTRRVASVCLLHSRLLSSSRPRDWMERVASKSIHRVSFEVLFLDVYRPVF
jgi:cyanate lyase